MSSESKSFHSLDDILKQIGDFKTYQILNFSLVCFAVVIHSAVHNAFVFTALNSNYRCKIPECDTSPPDYDAGFLTNAVPFKNKLPSKCETFLYNFSNVEPPIICTPDVFDKSGTRKCNDFVYETDVWSILQEYDLQCENNEWKLTMVGTVNSVGQFVGLFLGGLISDRFGRKFVLIWGMIFCAVFGLLRTCMTSYEWFLVFEFLDAVFGASTYICGFVLGVELVGPKKRVLTGILTSSSYALGEIFTAASAWAVKSWKPIIYILYSPSFLLIFYIWLVPESIRWLLSKGRTEEAKAILKRAAKFNNRELSESTLEKLTISTSKEEEEKGALLQACKSSILCIRLIVCAFCWIVCAFLFYGLTLNSVSLVAGNPYLDFMLTALIEIPAYVCSHFMLDMYGRRKPLFASFFVTGLACASFIFVPADSHAGTLAVFLIGKFGATLAFTNLYVHTSEMFPTKTRHTFMGCCSTLGRLGSMLAPQTPLLAQLWTPLPLVSFAVMAALACMLSLLFPETANIKLPDTIEEAENLSKLPKTVNQEKHNA
ncbi:unnamed protein product [Psylliodes chrysocephalus]|uniref:Major facilitator superfamily (MFS) profile domain-containing protein n=1 Tax=Psylliodes chrysocephalus TaxID=3402493 RepID=A0A9P0G959_9CUCU|nr:unnamed protein product [Psylliodes chrysocephala]